MSKAATVGWGVAAITAAAAILARPFPLRIAYVPNPASDYDEALSRLSAVQAAEVEAGVIGRGQSTLYAHGGPTEHVWVLLHGYTNCPYQFVKLAEMLHALGHTVFAPVAPGHGLATGWQTRLGQVGPHEMLRWAHAAVDIAQGLGRYVHVLGFSFGGVLAAWLAQSRSDLAGAVIASPALELQAVSKWQRGLYANLLPLLPDQIRWWDPVLRENRQGPPHAYVGFSTRGVGMILRLGLLIQSMAKRKGPRTQNITVVINESDDVVDNRAALRLAERWQQHGADVRTYTYAKSLQLIHDLMDPAQPRQKVDVAYPILLDLMQAQMNGVAPAYS